MHTTGKLVAVDIENLAGGADMTEATAFHVHHVLADLANLTPADMVVVASSHHAYLAWAFDWPGCRQLVASGPDGADHELLGVLESPAAHRMTKIIVASGDGIFTDVVARLGAHAHVTVIAPDSGCSRRLQMAAAETIYFPTQITSQEIA